MPQIVVFWGLAAGGVYRQRLHMCRYGKTRQNKAVGFYVKNRRTEPSISKIFVHKAGYED